MANTQTASELEVTEFRSDFFEEYVRKSRFSRYTGTGSNNVITIKEGRKKIEIPLVGRLKGAGVTGSNTLRGNGEAIANFGLTLTPTYNRHAVEFDREELEKPNIDLMRAARPLLMDWAMENQRDKIIEAMGAHDDNTTYNKYGDATATEHDDWNTNNQDRVLYGATKGNNTSGNHTTSLGTLDSTSDKLNTAKVSLAKRMAQQADPHIRPLRAEEDDEKFIMFCDPFAFRDLKTDSTLTQAQREAMVRGIEGHPLWTGGDLIWDNVVIREIPEIGNLIDDASGVWGAGATADSLKAGGDGGDRVGVSFLCGQQAVVFGLGQRPRIIIDRLFDYEFQPGVAVELKDDILQGVFGSGGTSRDTNTQHGIVTVYTNSAIDA